LKRSAIIVAGGTGTRMNSNIPKQFLLLDGCPLLLHCLNAFNKASEETDIVVVLPEAFIEEWERICSNFKNNIRHKVVPGGDTRFQSVKNALPLIMDDGFVAVHDGVRPLVTYQFINHCYDSASRMGNAVPVIPVSDSIRSVIGSESKPEDRRRFRIVQTPQVFMAKNLKKAYEQKFEIAFTDDASVVECTGEKIHLVEGMPGNLKITDPIDLRIAESLIPKNH